MIKSKALEKALDKIEKIHTGNMDVFEQVGVLLADVADMYEAKDSKAFLKQKKDARNVAKHILRQINNMTYAKLKIESREGESK